VSGYVVKRRSLFQYANEYLAADGSFVSEQKAALVFSNVADAEIESVRCRRRGTSTHVMCLLSRVEPEPARPPVRIDREAETLRPSAS
jgi:hypothetical protein